MKKQPNTFKKSERITSKKTIGELFRYGSSVFSYPLRITYRSQSPYTENTSPVAVVISAGKKNFKKAVDRNMLKRRMKEAYRLNKHHLVEYASKSQQNIYLSIVFVGKQPESFQMIEKKLIFLLERINEEIEASK